MNIAVVGAGPIGSLLSVYLAKRGYSVDLYERRADMRISGAEAGRSINLALSNRGLKPLEELGLSPLVERLVIPMDGRMIHHINSKISFQPYGKTGQFINSVSRSCLNKLLMNAAEEKGVKIHFNHRCSDVIFEENKLLFETGEQTKEVNADIILGADGAFSAVRAAMQCTDRFNFSQNYIEYGYKELTIPPARGDGYQINKHALHIWPRGKYMLIALPNLNGSFTCTLFFPFEGQPSFESLQTPADIDQFFKETFPDAHAIMPGLVETYQRNPTSSLVTIRCDPWMKHKTLLIGDAAHAIVPFYGQGMNSGFEDCRILNDLLNEHHEDWDTVFEKFNECRKTDTDAVADLALQNFVEMRDLVGNENFLLQKKIEARLHELYPDKWIPLYSMVTFNENISYAEAQRIGRKQQAIMNEVMETRDIEKVWETLDFKKIVEKLGG